MASCQLVFIASWEKASIKGECEILQRFTALGVILKGGLPYLRRECIPRWKVYLCAQERERDQHYYVQRTKLFSPKILLKESNSLILSYRIISHGILSYPMVSYRTLWYPIESHGILRIISYPTVFYHIPWYPMVSHPIPTLSHPIVLYLIVLYCYYIVHNFCKTLRWCGYPE